MNEFNGAYTVPKLIDFKLSKTILKKRLVYLIGLSFFLLQEKSAQAGMFILKLSDIARFRMESISFFLFIFLVCSYIIHRLWNYLKKDFDFLPFLTFKKSIVLTGLWGLVVLIVLTMISGARELMTPGAWQQKEGSATYQLADKKTKEVETEDPAQGILLSKRKAHLEKLQGTLWYFASQLDGNFPKSIEDSHFPDDYWKLPEKFDLKYQYFPNLKPLKDTKKESVVVVVELNLYKDGPLILKNDGTILQITQEEWYEIQKKGEGK